MKCKHLRALLDLVHHDTTNADSRVAFVVQSSAVVSVCLWFFYFLMANKINFYFYLRFQKFLNWLHCGFGSVVSKNSVGLQEHSLEPSGPWQERPNDESHSPSISKQLTTDLFLASFLLDMLAKPWNTWSKITKKVLLHFGDGSLVSKYW